MTDYNDHGQEGTDVEPAWPCPNCGSANYNWIISGAYAAKSCEDCYHMEVRR